jgi:hypothetical protein
VAVAQRMSEQEYEAFVLSGVEGLWELHDGVLVEKPGMSWKHLDIVTCSSCCSAINWISPSTVCSPRAASDAPRTPFFCRMSWCFRWTTARASWMIRGWRSSPNPCSSWSRSGPSQPEITIFTPSCRSISSEAMPTSGLSTPLRGR